MSEHIPRRHGYPGWSQEALIARAVDSQEIAAGDALEGAAQDLDAQIPRLFATAR